MHLLGGHTNGRVPVLELSVNYTNTWRCLARSLCCLKGHVLEPFRDDDIHLFVLTFPFQTFFFQGVRFLFNILVNHIPVLPPFYNLLDDPR